MSGNGLVGSPSVLYREHMSTNVAEELVPLRKTRREWRHECRGKVKHERHEDAALARAEMALSHHDPSLLVRLGAYRCAWCNHWHLGNRDRREVRLVLERAVRKAKRARRRALMEEALSKPRVVTRFLP